MAISGKIIGKRAKGRQGATLQEFTGLTAAQLTEIARDHDVWRETVHEASSVWDRRGTDDDDFRKFSKTR